MSTLARLQVARRRLGVVSNRLVVAAPLALFLATLGVACGTNRGLDNKDGAPGTGGGDAAGSGSGGATATGGETGTGGRSGSGGGPGSGGANSSGGATGRGGAVGSGGMAGSGGATGGRGGNGGMGSTIGPCTLPCSTGRQCCGAGCVNTDNDPFNCGECGHRCDATNTCSGGKCQIPECAPTTELCAPGSTCCGTACCAAGDLCCVAEGPITISQPSCYHPTAAAPTCPQGCAPLCKSDRNVKKDITPIDTAEILARVSRLPISSWTYIDEPPGIRHLGPMAQDFYASFGLGDSDRTYNSVDGHGVALAAIQGLDRVVEEERARIQALERENQALMKRLDALERRSCAPARRAR